jgi:hypothetical protein
MTKEELKQKYGCVECEATDIAFGKFKKVEDGFRRELSKRQEEIRYENEKARMSGNDKIGVR